MVIDGRPDGWMSFRAHSLVPADDTATTVTAFDVSVECGKFTAMSTFTAANEDVRAFVRALRRLERRSAGSAVLRATPHQLLLHIRVRRGATRGNASGHVAVIGSNTPSLAFSFDFHAGMVPFFTAQCEAWCPELPPGEEPAATRPPAPTETCLGLLSEFTAGMDDEQANKFMRDAATIVAKLGYVIASGREPEFDQLWAMPIRTVHDESVDADDFPPPAADFERVFLAWVHVMFRTLPVPRAPAGWTLLLGESVVEFTVTGDEPWTLEVTEGAPGEFLARVATHFELGRGNWEVLPDQRVRVQFRSTALVRPFVDQADET